MLAAALQAEVTSFVAYFSDERLSMVASAWFITDPGRSAPLKAILEAVAARQPQATIDDLLPWNCKPPS